MRTAKRTYSSCRQTLEASVRSHLISDVRVGSCLSGGLDSSTVVGLIGKIGREDRTAAAAIGDQLFTFTSCYDLEAFDEREYALQVAESVGAKPHLVFPTPEDFWSDFARMAWHQDMPFSMLNFYAQWRVMRAAKEAGVKVLLDGQGGDEVFGGYAKFRYAYIMSLLRRGSVATATREVAGMLRRSDRYVLDVRNGARYLPSVGAARAKGGFGAAARAGQPPQRRRGRREHPGDTLVAPRAPPGERFSHDTLMQQIQIDDIEVDTLPQLLRMEDRSSMAFSLEARVPLLDHKVVELGLSLPDRLKVNDGWSKFAVRAAMAGIDSGGSQASNDQARLCRAGSSVDSHCASVRRLPRCWRTISDAGVYVDVGELRRWYGSSHASSANTESFRRSVSHSVPRDVDAGLQSVIASQMIAVAEPALNPGFTPSLREYANELAAAGVHLAGRYQHGLLGQVRRVSTDASSQIGLYRADRGRCRGPAQIRPRAGCNVPARTGRTTSGERVALSLR